MNKIKKYQIPAGPLMAENWASLWKERLEPSAKSKVLLKWNSVGKKPKPESSKEYTNRRVKEETKRTWRSDAADIAHGIGEGVLALHPYTAIPYFGAKTLSDFVTIDKNGVLFHPEKASWLTALNASIPLFHMAPAPASVGTVVDNTLEDAAKAGSKTARNLRVAREFKRLVNNNNPILSNRTISVNRNVNLVTGKPDLTYTLYNEFGEPIGQTNIGSATMGLIERNGARKLDRMIDGVYSKNKAHKVSEDTYNVAVLDIIDNGGTGLESGWSLMMPLKTLPVTNKFPHVVIGLEFGNPVRLLTGRSSRPLPLKVLGNHYLEIKPKTEIKFNEISGEFEEVPIKSAKPYVSTSLKFFERKPSKISEAEKAGVPKGERFKNKKHYTGIGRNYRNIIFREESIPKDVEYVEPISAGKKFGENDYAFENRKYATKQYLKELNNRDSSIFSDKGVESIKEYISLLSNDINPNFINTNGLLSFYIRDFRLYLNDLGYRAGDLTDTEIAKLLTNLYDILSKNLTGKLKGKVVFHSGPNFFDLFDFSHTGENTGNMGYLGPGNYFSTKPSVYGGIGNYTTLDMLGLYRYPRRLPYLITNIKATPVSGELKETRIVPEFSSPPREIYTDLTAKQLYIDTNIKPIIEQTKPRDMAILDDISVSPHTVYTDGVQMEFMVPRNSGIKSIFPHPSLFIKDANGKITLNRNWDDIRVNYKQGGKMNILEFLKNGSGIHIKKENRGKFTDYCGGKVTSECIAKGKNSSNPVIRKRATFAANARKWKHKKGGQIELALEGTKLTFGQKVGNFLNSNLGQTLVQGGLSLLGTVTTNKSLDNLAEAQKAENELNAANAILKVMEEYLKNKSLKFKLWMLDYLSGKTMDLPSEIVSNHLGQEELNLLIANVKLGVKQKNAQMDMAVSLAKQDNWTTSIGGMLLEGLGTLGNYLGKKEETNTSAFLPKLTTNTYIPNTTLTPSLGRYSSSLYDINKFYNL